MGWTDERIELLKKLWADGYSASEVAAEVGGGITRSAVCGKVRRLGLVGRDKKASYRAPRPQGAEPRRAPSPPRALPPLPVLPFIPSAPSVSPANDKLPRQRFGSAAFEAVMALNAGECRFPLGDPLTADFKFCCSPIVAGSYCADHRLVAFDRVGTARANRRTPKPSFKGIYT